jgi:transposase
MRSKNGEAISSLRRTKDERRKLAMLLRQSERQGDLRTWRRAKAVLEYIGGRTVIAMSEELGVTRGSINRWLQWFEAEGTDGLKPRERPGPAPKLTEKQMLLVSAAIEAGPQAAGYDSGMWTGPMIGHWIMHRMGISYHNHHIYRGFCTS